MNCILCVFKIYFSKFAKHQDLSFVFDGIPKFCYRYVARPSLYERNEFCLRFLIAYFAKSKIHYDTPNWRSCLIHTRLFIRLSPLTVAFHSKNDLIIEMLHP